MPLIKYRVTLSKEERSSLASIATSGRHSSQKVLNALILLACDEGEYQDSKKTNQDIANVLPVSMKKIDRVKKRFVEQGLDVALDKQKGTRQYHKKVDGDAEAHLIALSCSDPPEGHTRWTLRLLANKVVELGYVEKISHETVRNVLKKTS
jgi:transposase